MTTWTPADYATAAILKDDLGIGNTAVDARLGRAITDASAAIDAMCSQPPGGFTAQTNTLLFDVGPSTTVHRAPLTDNSKGWVDRLGVPNLLSVTTLKTDEDGDGIYEVTWTAGADYLLYPLNDEVKREIVANPDTGRYGFPPGLQRVQVAGSWGLTEGGVIPYPIRRACLLLAGRYYKRPDALLGMAGDPAIGLTKLSQADPDVSALLGRIVGKYREQWLAA